jgi:hypothetical protein
MGALRDALRPEGEDIRTCFPVIARLDRAIQAGWRMGSRCARRQGDSDAVGGPVEPGHDNTKATRPAEPQADGAAVGRCSTRRRRNRDPLPVIARLDRAIQPAGAWGLAAHVGSATATRWMARSSRAMTTQRQTGRAGPSRAMATRGGESPSLLASKTVRYAGRGPSPGRRARDCLRGWPDRGCGSTERRQRVGTGVSPR